MSTEINVRVDRELLLQRDRVHRQAQRQVALEGTGQQKAATSGQEQVAKSGAAGGENRVRSSRTSTQTGGRGVPTSPVTAPFKRKPLPQLSGGAAGTTTPNNDSYLALPQPYTTLPYTWPGSDFGPPSTFNPLPGTALNGSKIKTGAKLGTAYIYYTDPYGYPDSGQDGITKTLGFKILDNSWQMSDPPTNSDFTNAADRLLISPASELAAGRVYKFFLAPPKKFTYEAICRIGTITSTDGTLRLSIGSSFWSMVVLIYKTSYNNASDFAYIKDMRVSVLDNGILGKLLLVASNAPFDVDSYKYTAFPNVSTADFIHYAFVYDGLEFAFYVNGQRLVAAPVGEWGYAQNAALDPGERYAYEEIDTTLISYNSTPGGGSLPGTVPVPRPAFKCIRYTAGKALYTGSSFTPPTSITRLA